MKVLITYVLSIGILLSCNNNRNLQTKKSSLDSLIQTDTTERIKKTKKFVKNRDCFCEKDKLMNEATISCDTTSFSNKSFIYWQYNCNKIWLTLENKNTEKFIIDSVPLEFYNYTYRLGYHMVKEFKSGLLFRSGCPANGPCVYTLIDKYNGKILDEFNQLIGIERAYKEPQYKFDFIVYFIDNQSHLVIKYLNKEKRLKVPFREKLTAAVPEQQFNKMTLENDFLILNYSSDRNVNRTLRINLNDKTYLF